MLFNSMLAAAVGLMLAAFYGNKVLSIKVTDSKVEELSSAIRQGSMAFLKRMYSWISVFVVILAVLFPLLLNGDIRGVLWHLLQALYFLH